jgi:hypothetical protein
MDVGLPAELILYWKGLSAVDAWLMNLSRLISADSRKEEQDRW